jgi:hypothetical protein
MSIKAHVDHPPDRFAMPAEQPIYRARLSFARGFKKFLRLRGFRPHKVRKMMPCSEFKVHSHNNAKKRLILWHGVIVARDLIRKIGQASIQANEEPGQWKTFHSLSQLGVSLLGQHKKTS